MGAKRKHRWNITVWLTIIFIVLASSAQGSNLKSLRNLFTRLGKLAPESGAVIFDIKTGNTIYSIKEHQLFVPASVAKLITSYVALKRLKPDYTFRTEIYSSGNIFAGKLNGNLYVKGFGDPFLVEEKIWILVQDLRSLGVRNISGDLIIDGSYFSPPVCRMKIDEYETRPYNPVLSAFSVDFNTVTFKIFPHEHRTGRCRISAIPESPYIEIQNQVKASKKTFYPKIAIARAKKKREVGEKFTIRGRVPLGAKPFEVRSNVSSPLLFSGYALKEKLQALGIKVDGKVKVGRVPPNATKLMVYRSPPLGEILYGLNRFSNNFMAEMLFRVLGAEVYGAPATVDKGRKVIEQELQKLNVTEREYVIVNGSGLSRDMKVSPYLMRKVLNAAYNDFSISAEFLSSMATPGTPGTLQHRFTFFSQHLPVLRAKTGSLDGVVTLAGYTRNSRGRVIGLVILCNKVSKPAKVKKLLDKIVYLLQQ